MNVLIAVALLASHILADVLQPKRWSVQKNHSVKALFKHSITYSLIISFLIYPLLGNIVLLFAILNCVFHAVVDSITSNLTAFFTKQGRMIAVGTTMISDQIVHLIFVYSTFMMFLRF